MTRLVILAVFLGGCHAADHAFPPVAPIVAVGGAYGINGVKDKPVTYKCENCRDTGIVGDGTIERPCPVCKPNAAAAYEESQKPVLYVYVTEGCVPCEKFKRDYAANRAAFNAVSVEFVEDGARAYPTFRLGDETKVGYTTLKDLLAWMQVKRS